MVHENENLNAAEGPNYHILIDWKSRDWGYFGKVADGRLTCSGHTVWQRLREILAKFITGIDSAIAAAKGESFTMTIEPPLLSVRPAKVEQSKDG